MQLLLHHVVRHTAQMLVCLPVFLQQMLCAGGKQNLALNIDQHIAYLYRCFVMNPVIWAMSSGVGDTN